MLGQKVTIKVKKLEHFHGELPKYESDVASGFDVRACLKESVLLHVGERTLIPTGLSFEIPRGYEIQVRPRSGLALKHGISLLNTPGTIDSDYRGEIKIILINHGKDLFKISDQDRIAQLVLCPVSFASIIEVKTLSETKRGSKGFGSTSIS